MKQSNNRYLISLIWVYLFTSTTFIFCQQIWLPTNSIDSFPVTTFLSDNNTLYAGMYGAGVSKTNDEGETWTLCNTGITNLLARDLIQNGSDLFLATTGGVFRSNNSGLSWSSATDTILDPDVWSLAFRNNKLYAGTNNGIYFSANDGQNWQKMPLPPVQANHQTIFDLVLQGNQLIAASHRFVYINQEGKDSWKPIALATSFDIDVLTVDGDYIYAGTTGNGIFYSKGGGTWTALNGYETGKVRFLRMQDNALIVGIPMEGIARGRVNMNEGFTTEKIRSITQHQNKLYAGSYRNGVWKYDIPQSPIIPEINRSKITQSVGVYPNPTEKGTIYLSYSLDTQTPVLIDLFHSNGQHAATIFKTTNQSDGAHQLSFNLEDFTTGTYLIRFQLGDIVYNETLVVLK